MPSPTKQDQTYRRIQAGTESTHTLDYPSMRKTARTAGLLYLIGAIMSAYAIMYVPSKIFVKGDAAATANNLLVHEFLFRTGIAGMLVSSVLSVFLLLLLYRLFKQVNEQQAKLMVAFVLVYIPIGFLLKSLEITALMIMKGDVLQTLSLEQKQNMAMLFLQINHYGTMSLELFWGVWLIPFGRLVYQSGFIPRALGVFLIINGIAFLIDSLTYLLFPAYKEAVRNVTFPLFFGELAIILWFLIKGVKQPALRPTTPL